MDFCTVELYRNDSKTGPIRSLLVILTCAVSLQCQAQNITIFQRAHELLLLCTSKVEWQQAACLGYATAVVDTHEVLADQDLTQRLACLPRDVSREEIQDVVVRHLQANPDDLGLPASAYVLTALAKYFPCE
jgi:hypothetical protein